MNGKAAIVTGAGGGIGRAICLRLIENGVRVAVTDLRAENAQKVAEEINDRGGSAYGYKADVTNNREIRSVVRQVLEAFGHIDILINNAGGSAALLGKLSRFKDSTEEIRERIIDINLHGTMRFAHAVIPGMIDRKGGRIINLSSIAGTVGIIDRVDYSAAKAGVIGMTRALAMELGVYGITVNAVSPGLISRTSETAPSDGTFLGRTGDQKEVASLVAFLASSEAGFITGANYIIDGGRTLGPTGGRREKDAK